MTHQTSCLLSSFEANHDKATCLSYGLRHDLLPTFSITPWLFLANMIRQSYSKKARPPAEAWRCGLPRMKLHLWAPRGADWARVAKLCLMDSGSKTRSQTYTTLRITTWLLMMSPSDKAEGYVGGSSCRVATGPWSLGCAHLPTRKETLPVCWQPTWRYLPDPCPASSTVSTLRGFPPGALPNSSTTCFASIWRK